MEKFVVKEKPTSEVIAVLYDVNHKLMIEDKSYFNLINNWVSDMTKGCKALFIEDGEVYTKTIKENNFIIDMQDRMIAILERKKSYYIKKHGI